MRNGFFFFSISEDVPKEFCVRTYREIRHWERYFAWWEQSAYCEMLIPNNLPGIVGSARSIITSASLLRRAVHPPTRKSDFAYLVDRGDRFCRKGVGIPPYCARHSKTAFRYLFFLPLFLTGNENTVSRWRRARARIKVADRIHDCRKWPKPLLRNWEKIIKHFFLKKEQKELNFLRKRMAYRN